jgi:tetratricopeptide (TPR) repeat protein
VAADSILRLADVILARDSVQIIAATLRAHAATSVARATRGDASAARSRAMAAWGRVLTLRPDSADLAVEAVETYLQLSRPREALDALERVDELNPSEIRYPRLRFRALHTLARWPEAAALGDSLELVDRGFSDEPVYALRYVEALANSGDTIRAVAKSAKSVTMHPGEGRLYVQYVELIAGEHTVALTRGLARFPSLAPLRVLAAQRARSRGDATAERSALADAVGADATLSPAYLRLAELWFQDARPDSALRVLTQAPREGESAPMLRAYLVGRGLSALRTAVDSVPETYTMALALLALADSVSSADDSRGLVVAATLQQARAHLVVGAAGRRCEPIRAAEEELVLAAGVLARGVGEGSSATELHEAHAGLQAAVSEAERVICDAVR